MHQMRLTQADTAVQEQRIKALAGGLLGDPARGRELISGDPGLLRAELSRAAEVALRPWVAAG